MGLGKKLKSSFIRNLTSKRCNTSENAGINSGSNQLSQVCQGCSTSGNDMDCVVGNDMMINRSLYHSSN